DACGSHPGRHRPRRHTVLYRRWPSLARAAERADSRACRHLLDDRPPRSAPRALRARGYRLDQGAVRRTARPDRRRRLGLARDFVVEVGVAAAGGSGAHRGRGGARGVIAAPAETLLLAAFAAAPGLAAPAS